MKCNVGSKERVIRLSIGAAAAALLFLGHFEGAAKIVLAVVAVVGLASGLLRFCPLNCLRKPKS